MPIIRLYAPEDTRNRMKYESLYRRCLSGTKEGVVNGMDRQKFIDHMVVKYGAIIDDAVDQALAQGWTEHKTEVFITSMLNLATLVAK